MGCDIHWFIDLNFICKFEHLEINDPGLAGNSDNLASRTGQVGAVTSLTYGWMIMQVPETLIGTAIATAMLPTLSEFAANRNWTGFRQTIEKALKVLIALTLPVAAVMAASLHPLVRAVFGFEENTSTLLTWTARIYLLTLAGYAVQETLVRAFYARQEPWPPFFSVLLRLTIYLALGISAIVYFQPIGAPAIAFAEVAATFEAVILFLWLNRRLPDRFRVGSTMLKSLVACLVGAAVTYAVALWLPGGAVLTAMVGILAGGFSVLPIIWPEIRLLCDL